MDDNDQSVQEEKSVSQDGFPNIEDSNIQEGEVVQDNSQVLTSLDEMIKANVKSIDRLKEDVKKLREMLSDGLSNDAVYKEHDYAVKAAQKILKATRAQIMKQPAIVELSTKLKTLVSELKEKNMALSDYLLEYQKLSGANQIETDEGEVLEIINSARIVKRASVK